MLKKSIAVIVSMGTAAGVMVAGSASVGAAPAVKPTTSTSVPSLRAEAIPVVRVTKAKKRAARAKLRFDFVYGKISVKVTHYKLRSKKKTYRTYSYNLRGQTKTLKLRKYVSKVSISGAVYNTRSFGVSKKSVNKRYRFSAKKKPSPPKPKKYWDLSRGSKNDWTSGNASMNRGWETCIYTSTEGGYFPPNDHLWTLGRITKVTPSNVVYWRGTIPSTLASGWQHALDATSAATGYKFVKTTDKKRKLNVIDVKTENTRSRKYGVVYNLEPGYSTYDHPYAPGSGKIWFDYNTSMTKNQVASMSMYAMGGMMGLGNAKSSSQVMYSTSKGHTTWGAGDYAGLQKFRYKGCSHKVGDADPKDSWESYGNPFGVTSH